MSSFWWFGARRLTRPTLQADHHSDRRPVMKPDDRPTRRRFLAASSGALVAGSLPGQDEKPDAAKLALHGGPKAVTERAPKLVRWGKPERDRLDAMIGQDSLFYWKGPQTAALVERFRRVCPLKH